MYFQIQAIVASRKRAVLHKAVLHFFINSRTAIAGAIIGLLMVFYNSKNLNCIEALSFFKICSHIFIGVVNLVTPKQEVEQKSEWFSGVKFFCSNFKVE